MSYLLSAFVLALVGSVHCIAMCGGFSLAVASGRPGSGSPRRVQGLYYLGKTMTYAILGAFAGGLSQALGATFSLAQDVLSITLGLFMVFLGLGLTGYARRLEGPRFVARLTWYASAMGRLLQRRTSGASLGLGLLNGLLPCGLVYGALAIAATTGDAAHGTLTMAVFGLSTLPALHLTAAAHRLIPPAWRTRMHQLGGVLVILLGLVTLARGLPLSAPATLHHEGHLSYEREGKATPLPCEERGAIYERAGVLVCQRPWGVPSSPIS